MRWGDRQLRGSAQKGFIAFCHTALQLLQSHNNVVISSHLKLYDHIIVHHCMVEYNLALLKLLLQRHMEYV